MTTTQYNFNTSFDHGTYDEIRRYDSCLKVAKTALMAGVVRNALASRSFKFFWTWDYFASLPELQSASECRLQSHWRCKYGPRKCLALRRSLVGSCRVQISHQTSSDIVQRLLDKRHRQAEYGSCGHWEYKVERKHNDMTPHDTKRKNREKKYRSAIFIRAYKNI